VLHHLQFLATRMLINLDEMESYNKTDIGVMKSVISTAQVSLRLPYGRTAQNMKRRASFCGSINDRQFLRDETGSRRWFIIEVDTIDFNNDQLTISGERKIEKEQEELNYHTRETRYGTFSRTFHLPENVNDTKIQAAYNDGILKITLPKDEKKELKRTIKIN